jgi:superfamily I DNA/RNA helicase/mRNA-degrading endonuclease RelE of RelBE toxin-antitoxin system
MVMRFGFSSSFQDSLDKLDNERKQQVKSAMFDLQTGPPPSGFDLKKLRGQQFWSGRINRGIRMIMHRDDGLNMALYVGPRNDAHAWARNHRFQEHPETKSLQLFSVEHITEHVVHREEVTIGPRLFDRYDDEYLHRLGVPEELIPSVKQATEEDLTQLIDDVPPEAMDRLMLLSEGKTVPVPKGFPGEPLEHPDTKRSFVTVRVKSDLATALDYPWAKWMVFLHPDQQDLVGASFSGPAKVSGPAGSGKTILALHRAFRLAKESPSEQVLLTTYSKTLSDRIEHMATILAGGAEQIPENLTVMNIHRLAVQIWSDHNEERAFKAAEPNEVNKALEAAIGLRILGPMSLELIASEWRNVIDYWGISDMDSYRAISRTGRWTVLGQNQRKELWSVFGPVLEKFSEDSEAMTWSQMTFAAARLAEQENPKRYRHVIVDESQDFGPAELQLTRALTESAADDIFLCGDAAQRIFRRPFSWTSVGVHIQGRSRSLSANYRNTQEIQKFAQKVLLGTAVGGDGEKEDNEAVSLLTGAEPSIKICENEAEETACLAEWLEEMIQLGYDQGDIAVFTRRTRTLGSVCDPALRLVGGLNRRDLQESRPPSEEGVSFGTMHRAKGLEFKAVAVVGCGDDDVPDKDALSTSGDEGDRQEVLEEELNLLHVAITRPRERLLVTCAGNPSRFLDAALGGKDQKTLGTIANAD